MIHFAGISLHKRDMFFAKLRDALDSGALKDRDHGIRMEDPHEVSVERFEENEKLRKAVLRECFKSAGIEPLDLLLNAGAETGIQFCPPLHNAASTEPNVIGNCDGWYVAVPKFTTPQKFATFPIDIEIVAASYLLTGDFEFITDKRHDHAAKIYSPELYKMLRLM